MSIQYHPDELYVNVPGDWFQEDRGYYWERPDNPLEKIYASRGEAEVRCTAGQITTTLRDCVHQMLIDRLQWAKTV